jgi:hypothetical protein
MSADTMKRTQFPRWAISGPLLLILLSACGESLDNSAGPAIAAKPDVIITIDGKRHACLVALYAEPQGSEVSCDEVAGFVKDELRVPSRSIYDIRIVPEVNGDQIHKVAAGLNMAGYRFIGGPHAKLIIAAL